jgi:DNA invertase Pin-like site-specific DNA recombinase
MTCISNPSPRGQRVGYVRVSTLDQNTERQLDGLALDEVFEDKASGKDTQRPQLQAALKHLRKGDTLIIHSIDRLARSLADLERIIGELNGRGVVVEFVKERLVFSGAGDDPMAVLMRQMLGAVAQFERALIRERQREGITLAKAAGKFKGGKPKLSEEQVAALVAQDIANEGRNRKALAQEFGISRETLYQRLTEAGRITPKEQAA